MASNLLTGTLPDSFAGLTQLQYLYEMLLFFYHLSLLSFRLHAAVPSMPLGSVIDSVVLITLLCLLAQPTPSGITLSIASTEQFPMQLLDCPTSCNCTDQKLFSDPPAASYASFVPSSVSRAQSDLVIAHICQCGPVQSTDWYNSCKFFECAFSEPDVRPCPSLVHILQHANP